MTRIDRFKETRQKRKKFIPERTLFLPKKELINFINQRIDLKDKRSIGAFIVWLNSPNGWPYKSEIVCSTKFLDDENVDITLKERISALLTNLKTKPKCENIECNRYPVFVDMSKKYRRFCSTKCSANNKMTKQKREETNLKVYGNKIAFNNLNVRNKHRETLFNRYGVTNSFHLTSSYSKISQELFWNVWSNSKQYGEQHFGELNGEFRINNNGKIIKPDYVQINGDDKRIIEFLGDYWHQDENKDRERIEVLETMGFKVLCIKERDYMKDKLKIIDNCISFLNGCIDL